MNNPNPFIVEVTVRKTYRVTLSPAIPKDEIVDSVIPCMVKKGVPIQETIESHIYQEPLNQLILNKEQAKALSNG